MSEPDSKRMWMPRWIIDEMLVKLSDSEVRVFLVYTRHANADGESYPGNPLIAYKTGLSIRSVQRAVRSLVTKGLLSKVSSGTGGRRVFTRYRVLSQSWKEYQDAARGSTGGTNHDTSGTENAPKSAVSGSSEEPSEQELSTKGDRLVMVCGEPEPIPRQLGVRVCGKLSTKGDTAVMEREPQSEKPCHPCRKTMTPGVVNHDTAMSPEVIKKKFFKGDGLGDGENHDNGGRQTTGIEGTIKGMAKRLFRRITSPCNPQTQADKMIQDLRRHLAEQKEQPAGATVAV